MKGTLTSSLAVGILLLLSLHATQVRAQTVPPSTVPDDVIEVLQRYVAVLRAATTLDDAARGIAPLAGGALVNEDGRSLRRSVQPYSLKKDWQNVRYYADPLIITRVTSSPNPFQSGYGPSAIQGRLWKIWIGKRQGVDGVPAPISILEPVGHPSIMAPKLIGIGSL